MQDPIRRINGEMAEWSNALPWKGSIWATVSGVRIPVSPPACREVLLNLYEALIEASQ